MVLTCGSITDLPNFPFHLNNQSFDQTNFTGYVVRHLNRLVAHYLDLH